jgi:CheY-like chemotaxis protein/HPt (histidine-containing phosphotransfer) domain-containing protein
MQVDLAVSGFKALEMVREKRYDMVFMDHRMPDMDGVETTRRIRKMNPEDPYYKNLPVVALTANAVSGVMEMFLQNGFSDYLSKPIDTVRMNAVLKKWIPAEKHREAFSEEEAPAGADNFTSPENAFEIGGLDVEKGIRLSGGTLAYYHETLAVFCEDGSKKRREIIDCLESGDMSMYSLHLHSLKSAAANIGADSLSRAAYDLETAGLRGDRDFIIEKTADFLRNLEETEENILAALPSRDAAHKNGTDGPDEPDDFDGETGGGDKTEDLRGELIKLKSALENMNAGEVNRAVDTLLYADCGGALKEGLRKISRHILMAEHEEAEAAIESLLREI